MLCFVNILIFLVFNKNINFIYFLNKYTITNNKELLIIYPENTKNSFLKQKKNFDKKRKIELQSIKKHSAINVLALSCFLDNFYKNNYIIHLKMNFFEPMVYKYLRHFAQVYLARATKFQYLHSFLFHFLLMLQHNNPMLLQNWFRRFFLAVSYKLHKVLASVILVLKYSLNKEILDDFSLQGISMKFRGKFTGRAGDRRKTIIIRIEKHSCSDPKNNYIIQYKQLLSKTGTTGCVIALLLK